jgi:hypothetical protein
VSEFTVPLSIKVNTPEAETPVVKSVDLVGDPEALTTYIPFSIGDA